MVGTRTTARDRQWLDDMMAEDASAERLTQKIRRMPESYGRQRGAARGDRGGRGHGEGCNTAPTQQTQGGASSSKAVEAAGTSTQTQGTKIPSTQASPSQAMLAGISSSGFQQMISDILLEGDDGCRSDTQFDGSQVHLDLNEPVSGPSHVFMALGRTPPSAAHVSGGSWEVPFMELARLPTPPASPASAEQPEEPVAHGQSCGTGGHM
ncbi:hypothetical protein PIB30_000391 [Stylosanthes scabra]|uniref:Uncharacterized protein n=1 Tax=Stylosanthes scabra TaxID=79078 RepID=A0ABU6U287_9FABA|nr:hypothetical protein [Stylosanthes scabra]